MQSSKEIKIKVILQKVRKSYMGHNIHDWLGSPDMWIQRVKNSGSKLLKPVGISRAPALLHSV